MSKSGAFSLLRRAEIGVDLCDHYRDDVFEDVVEELKDIETNHFLWLRDHESLVFSFGLQSVVEGSEFTTTCAAERDSESEINYVYIYILTAPPQIILRSLLHHDSLVVVYNIHIVVAVLSPKMKAKIKNNGVNVGIPC